MYMFGGRRHRLVLGAGSLLACGALIAGCGGSSHPSSASTGGHHGSGSKGSQEISFVRAADVSSAASGFKMAMTIATTVAGKHVTVDANGSFSPKSHEASMTMDVGIPGLGSGAAMQLQMVLTKDTMYMKLPASLAGQLPGGKQWFSLNLTQMSKLLKVPGYGSMFSESSSMSNPGQYLDYLKAVSGGTIKNLGQATVDGVQTTHYQADVNIAKLPDSVPAADRATVSKLMAELQSKSVKLGTFPMNVWIDGSDLVRKIQMSMNPTISGQSTSETITLNITDYGQQPAPVIPPASETTNLTSLLSGISSLSG